MRDTLWPLPQLPAWLIRILFVVSMIGTIVFLALHLLTFWWANLARQNLDWVIFPGCAVAVVVAGILNEQRPPHQSEEAAVRASRIGRFLRGYGLVVVIIFALTWQFWPTNDAVEQARNHLRAWTAAAAGFYLSDALRISSGWTIFKGSGSA